MYLNSLQMSKNRQNLCKSYNSTDKQHLTNIIFDLF